MNESYVYIEPEDRVKRRNEIRTRQVPIEDLQKLVSKGATEHELQKVIKKDLSFLADVFAYREEYERLFLNIVFRLRHFYKELVYIET